MNIADTITNILAESNDTMTFERICAVAWDAGLSSINNADWMKVSGIRGLVEVETNGAAYFILDGDEKIEASPEEIATRIARLA